MKYIHFSRTPLFYMGLFCVVGISLILAHYTQSPYSGDCHVYNVEITLETEQEAGLELYYNVGRKFNEKDHQETAIEAIGEKVTIQFAIPVWTMLERIRIDPVGAGLKMHLYQILVSSADGKYSYNVSLDSINPGQQILHGHWDGISYSFETAADAHDPILMDVGIDDPYLEKKEKSYGVYVLWALAALCTTLFCNWIFRFFILGL